MYIKPEYIYQLGKSYTGTYDLLVNKIVIHKTLGEGKVLRVERKRGKSENVYFYIMFDKEREFTDQIFFFLSEIQLENDDIKKIKEIETNICLLKSRRYQSKVRNEYINKTKIENNNQSKFKPMISSKYNALNQQDSNLIRDFIKEHSITELIHFTQLDNLDSIMEFGLLSVNLLRKKCIKYNYNDSNRLDNLTNTISLSIGFPNYKLFYKLRDKDKSKKWIVIKLKPEVLYEKSCLFCTDNAASYEISNQSLYERSGIKALKRLFYDCVDGNNIVTRDELGIKKYHTTNPQAEVLVFDKIEPKYIKSIIFSMEDKELLMEYCEKYKNIKVIANNSYFSSRYDYKYWGGYYGQKTCVYSE